MQVSDYTSAITAMHLVFLEIDTHHCHLDFKLLDENNNVNILRTFYLQLLNKDYEDTGKVSMAECASGVASSETSSFFFLVTVTTGKSFKIFTINQEKHNAIKLLAQSKLDNIADIVSQAMQDEDISSFEFHKVLQEAENITNLRLILEPS